MKSADRHALEVLEAVAADASITQRSLSTRLGIALGLTNVYVRRMTRKGFIKCVGIRSNRLRYLITPKGIAEKARLTYQFMDYSLRLYAQVRCHLRETLVVLVSSGHARIGIYGTGEAAELAYLSMKELGLEPTVVLDQNGQGEFLGMKVHRLNEESLARFDRLIVATLEQPDGLIVGLVQQGVRADGLITLRPLLTDRPEIGVHS